MERKLQDKEKEIELRIIPRVARASEQGIVEAMSQVSLKELEITGLKNQNKNLEDIAGKRELERNKLEDKCKELVDKNNKLTKQVTGQSTLQGAKHLIWDVLIAEATKLGPYFDFILEKDIVTQAAKKIS